MSITMVLVYVRFQNFTSNKRNDSVCEEDKDGLDSLCLVFGTIYLRLGQNYVNSVG